MFTLGELFIGFLCLGNRDDLNKLLMPFRFCLPFIIINYFVVILSVHIYSSIDTVKHRYMYSDDKLKLAYKRAKISLLKFVEEIRRFSKLSHSIIGIPINYKNARSAYRMLWPIIR